MRKRIAALLCVLLLLSGCSGGAEPSDGYVLYFQERDLRSAAGEGALRTDDLEPTEAPARALLEALLAGPTDETLKMRFRQAPPCCPWS
ncbi:MAG: hypothetical protein V8R75_03810 [Oscillospiraceae bacterium]